MDQDNFDDDIFDLFENLDIQEPSTSEQSMSSMEGAPDGGEEEMLTLHKTGHTISMSEGSGEKLVDLNVHPSGIVPTLRNVVASGKLNCPLDLKEIALHAPNTGYNPEKPKVLTMRITEPEAKAFIFASGNMVVGDTKSEKVCLLAAFKYADIIQKLGYPTNLTDFRIQSLVGSCDIPFQINLEGLALLLGANASYKPKRFKALIYRMVNPKIVLLIFEKGKVVLTGAKVREEIFQAFENIYPVLTDFRKQLSEQREVGFRGADDGNKKFTVRMNIKF